MGRFAEKHPRELTALVGQAIANGATTADVRRQLADGTFHGWPNAYDMPLETVRYYGKKERRKRAATTVSKEAKEAPKQEVDRLARLLLSGAQAGLTAARPTIDHDPKALKEWADALKAINALVSDTSQPDKPKKGKREPVPNDPLSTALLTADKTTTNINQTNGPNTRHTSNHDNTHTDSGGVAVPGSATSIIEVPGEGRQAQAWPPINARAGRATGTG